MLLAKIVILYPVILKTKCLNKICSCLQMPNNIHLQNVIMTRKFLKKKKIYTYDGMLPDGLVTYAWVCLHYFYLVPFSSAFPACCSKLLVHDVITCFFPPLFSFFFNINIKSLLWDTVLQVTPKMLYTGLVWVSC